MIRATRKASRIALSHRSRQFLRLIQEVLSHDSLNPSQKRTHAIKAIPLSRLTTQNHATHRKTLAINPSWSRKGTAFWSHVSCAMPSLSQPSGPLIHKSSASVPATLIFSRASTVKQTLSIVSRARVTAFHSHGLCSLCQETE